jgi:hypothetical protein
VSQSWAHTCGAAATMLFAYFFERGGGSPSTASAAYAGVPMTEIGTGYLVPGDRWVHVFYLANPAAGSHTLTTGASSADAMGSAAASYTGTAATIDNSNSGSASAASSITVSLTPTADNCWVILFAKNDSGSTAAGSGATARVLSSGSVAIMDNNAAIHPAASTSLTASFGSNADWSGVLVSIAP